MLLLLLFEIAFPSHKGASIVWIIEDMWWIYLSILQIIYRERRLLQVNDDWPQIMKDAERTKLPRTIRDLFAILLTNIEINSPWQLWNLFKNKISEDFLQIVRRTINDSNIMINERHHEETFCSSMAHLETWSKPLKNITCWHQQKVQLIKMVLIWNYCMNYNTTETNSMNLYYWIMGKK